MPLSLRITPLVFLAMVTCSLPLTVSIYEKGSCNEDKISQTKTTWSFKHNSYNLLAVIYFYSSLINHHA